MDMITSENQAMVKFVEENEARVVRDFNEIYWNAGQKGGTWRNTRFLNIPIFKYPTDLWAYQEIITETRPEVIVETGTAYGGSALWFAFLCQTLGQGEVITVDTRSSAEEFNEIPRPSHPLITYLTGSSTDLDILTQIKQIVAGRSTLVVLDSDHSRDHVLAEMKLYAPFVQIGGYMVVEDGIINGNPCYPESGPGPTEAMEAFFLECNDFRVDTSREKYMLTQNPCGFLLRITKTGEFNG